MTGNTRGLTVTETHWGYIIREAEGRFDTEAIVEAALRFVGLILVIAAYAQWLLPGSLFVGDAVSMKMVLSLVLVTMGVVTYMVANRGFRREVQVDVTRRQVRFATYNGRGASRWQSSLPMDQINSVFVRRSKEIGVPSTLFFRLIGQPEPIRIADGAMDELDRLHERLCIDFQPPRVRVEAKMAAQSARFSSGRRSARVA